MLKSFNIGKFVDLADFGKLTEFLEAVGFARAAHKEDVFGCRNASFSVPAATISISTLTPEAPPVLDRHANRLSSWSIALQTSDPAHIFEVAQRMGFHVRLIDSAIEWSGNDPFTVELPGNVSVRVGLAREERSAGVGANLDDRGKRFGIVVARFNSFITERLLQSALDGLLNSGANRDEIQIARVPGALEIPLAARSLAETKKYDAVICIGCLLRGDTAHYDVIVNEVTRGIGQSAQETGVPHAFGVLTCENLEQAIDRAGLKMGNKGFEAALAAVEMASLAAGIRRPASGVRKAGSGRQLSAAGKQQIPRFARNEKSKKKTKRK